MKKTIKWICQKCQKQNEIETHSDPAAHFVSMLCEYCGDEIEDCLCDWPNQAAQALGRLSAKIRREKYGHNNEYYRKLSALAHKNHKKPIK